MMSMMEWALHTQGDAATAEASVEQASFGAAWRDYVASTEFNTLPEHDRALIRVAFVSGWRARGAGAIR